MNISIPFYVVLEICLIAQCVFSIIYLSMFNWNKNKWLILLFASILLSVLALEASQDRFGFFIHNGVNHPGYTIAFFPALYLYAKSLIGIKTENRFIHGLYFSPILFFIPLFIFYSFPSPENLVLGSIPFYLFVGFVSTMSILGLLCSFQIIKLIGLNERKYVNQFSQATTFITLTWLKGLLGTIFLVTFLGLSLTLSQSLLDISNLEWMPAGSALLIVTVLSIFSFRQPVLYEDELSDQEGLILNKVSGASSQTIIYGVSKAKKSSSTYQNQIPEEEQQAIVKRIEDYMETHQPFLNPKIKMPELAAALNLSSNIFSFIINKNYNINFFKFINGYRVEYAKQLLVHEDYQHYNLETIGHKAGFNSKTTFNTRFKEITSFSPKQYQKKEGASHQTMPSGGGFHFIQ